MIQPSQFKNTLYMLLCYLSLITLWDYNYFKHDSEITTKLSVKVCMFVFNAVLCIIHYTIM